MPCRTCVDISCLTQGRNRSSTSSTATGGVHVTEGPLRIARHHCTPHPSTPRRAAPGKTMEGNTPWLNQHPTQLSGR